MLSNPDKLAVVGPTSPEHGFPMWYKDSTGVRLELAVDSNDPFTPAMGDLPSPGLPVLFPINFPDECFYMLADAEMPTGGTATPGRARVVLALEAAFGGTGDVVPGQQVVFGRVRLRIRDAVPGALYTFTHPYGQSDPLEADEDGRVDFTEDIGVAPLAFAGALGSEVAPFLQWTSGTEKAPGEADPPSGYVGDGATPHTITGSALGFNFVRIEGPNIADAGGPRDPADPGNINKILTPLFTLQGRLARVAGVDVSRAVYSRPSAVDDVMLDVWASSEVGQTIQISGAGINPTQMQGGFGRYFARASTGIVVPVLVQVSNTSDTPDTTKSVPVTDAVTVTRADYDAVARTLDVAATSSDVLTAPTLTVNGFGPLAGGQAIFAGVDAPPVTVEVTSSAGGLGNRVIAAIGAALSTIPVVAHAGIDQTVQQGQTVTLNGLTSEGGVTSFSWSQTAGSAVVLNVSNAAITTFVAPAVTTDLSFVLTVQGPGGPSVDAVDVHVAPLAPPVANAGTDVTAAVGSVVTLDGSASQSTASFLWTQVSGTSVGTITDATTANPQFTMPLGAVPVGIELTATGPGGPSSTDTVTITPLVDVLNIQRIQFRVDNDEWRIDGTATGPLPDTVIVTFAGQEIGRSPVDAAFGWDVRRTLQASEGALRPTAGSTVTVTSSRGANEARAIDVRN